MPVFIIKRQITGTNTIDWKNYTYSSWATLFTYLDNQDTFLPVEISIDDNFIDLNSSGSLFAVNYLNGFNRAGGFIKAESLTSVNNYLTGLGYSPINITKMN